MLNFLRSNGVAFVAKVVICWKCCYKLFQNSCATLDHCYWHAFCVVLIKFLVLSSVIVNHIIMPFVEKITWFSVCTDVLWYRRVWHCKTVNLTYIKSNLFVCLCGSVWQCLFFVPYAWPRFWADLHEIWHTLQMVMGVSEHHLSRLARAQCIWIGRHSGSSSVRKRGTSGKQP